LQQATDNEYELIKNVSRKKYKIKYILPEINLSKDKFIIHKNKIVWALVSIKGIGIKAAIEIVKEQPFDSFEDFFTRVNKRVINIRVMKILIISNAFRKFGGRNKISRLYAMLRKDKERLKMTKEEWSFEASQIMPYNKQSVRELFPDKMGSVINFEEFTEKDIGERVVIAGIIDYYRELQSKRGMMIIMKITNIGESYSVVCWNDYFNKIKDKGMKLGIGMPIKVSGHKNLSNRDEEQITLGKESSAYIKILK